MVQELKQCRNNLLTISGAKEVIKIKSALSVENTCLAGSKAVIPTAQVIKSHGVSQKGVASKACM